MAPNATLGLRGGAAAMERVQEPGCRGGGETGSQAGERLPVPVYGLVGVTLAVGAVPCSPRPGFG